MKHITIPIKVAKGAACPIYVSDASGLILIIYENGSRIINDWISPWIITNVDLE